MGGICSSWDLACVKIQVSLMRHVMGRMEWFIERMASPFELMTLNDHRIMNANVVISQIITTAIIVVNSD